MRIGIAMLLLVTAGACGGSGGGGETISGPQQPPQNPGGPGQSASVEMRSVGDIYGDLVHSFNPTSVTIARTGTVTWANATGEIHNVTFGAQAGSPANIGDHSNGTNGRTFATSGTFNYSCTNHPGMAGSVVVQ